MARGDLYRPPRGCGDPGAEGYRQHPKATSGGNVAGDQENDDRKSEVKLLFDGQRPERRDERGVDPGHEVVAPRGDEAEVGGEQRRPTHVPGQVGVETPAERHFTDHQGAHEGGRGRRHDTADAPGVEVGQPEAHTLAGFAQQQLGDDVAADDEEHVDADVAAAKAGHAGVVADHQYDGDGAKALDVTAELPTGDARLVAFGRKPATSACGGRRHVP